MSYRFVEHLTVADVAFEARGATLEELFASAGRAVTAVMIKDLRSIRLRDRRPFSLTADDVEQLLFNFLQEIVFYKDVEQLLLRSFALKVSRHKNGTASLSGMGSGERIDPDHHHLLVDVKAVTMHRFRLVKAPGRWEATVVLDI